MRGGSRPGAGRPVKSADDKRVALVLSVAPETKAWLKEVASAQSCPMGQVVEKLIKIAEQQVLQNRK